MEYIKNIALFLVLISFVENVLAFGNMKKYIRLFCGIVVIFLLFQPISEILGENINIDEMLEFNELEHRIKELNDEMDEKDMILEVIEENINQIVSDEGYELTYVLIIPSEENSSDIGGINISIKEKNSSINVEKIDISNNENQRQSTVEVTRISEKIANAYNIEQSNVIINIE